MALRSLFPRRPSALLHSTLPLVIALAALGASPAAGQIDAREHLATIFTRRALDTLNVPEPTVSSLDLATLLLEEAVALDPESEEISRLLLSVARVSENRDLRKRMVAEVSRLAPDDDWLQLEKLVDALARFQTADELRDAYGTLLSEANIDRMNPAIASRLAMDYAVLLQREGDDAAFAEWVGRATSLDQTNKAAAGTAAGYFNVRVDDPLAQGELFVNVLLADPTDPESQAALARHLLTHGAHAGAARMYMVLVASHEAMGVLPANDLVVDLAIAQWGTGRHDLAMATIDQRVDGLDLQARMEAWRHDPLLTPLQRAAVRATLPIPLAAARMALLDREIWRLERDVHREVLADDEVPPQRRALAETWLAAQAGEPSDRIRSLMAAAEEHGEIDARMRALVDIWLGLIDGNADAAATALADLISTDRDQWLAKRDPVVRLGIALVMLAFAQHDLDRFVDQALAHPDVPQQARFEAALSRAWMAAWMGMDAAPIEQHVEAAKAQGEIRPEAAARFEGFAALRRGEIEAAAALLAPLAENDVAARVGMAMVHDARGDAGMTAAALLDIWRADPATLIGVWSRDWLEGINAGAAGRSDLAERLEEVAAAIPTAIDRMPAEPMRMLSMRLEPVSREISIFDPLLVRLVLTNNSSLPLAISPRGPITPHVLIEPRITIPRQPQVDIAEPVVLNIGRRLRLMPRERLEILFDLRLQRCFELIDRAATNGAIVELKATLNYRLASASSIMPGLLGLEARSGLLRINGDVIDKQWLERTFAAVAEPGDIDDLRRLAQLAHTASFASAPNDPPLASLIADSPRVLAESFLNLPPEAQAWLLAVIPSTGAGTEPVRQHARQSPHRLVMLSFMLHQTREDEDPVTLAAQRSDDTRLRRAAELFNKVKQEQSALAAQAEEAARQGLPPQQPQRPPR